MKKAFILILSLAVFAFVSCGKTDNNAMRTDMDSVSYAFGIDLANNVHTFDSTINVELFIQAFRDRFDNKERMTVDQAKSYIGQYMAVGMSKRNDNVSRKWFDEVVKQKENVQKTPGGMYYIIEKPGGDRKINFGDTVSINYIIKNTAGGTLISRMGEDQTYEIVLKEAGGNNIAGLTEGLMLVGQGGKISLFVPWELAYGERGAPNIKVGPKQSVEIDIEVLKVKPRIEEL